MSSKINNDIEKILLQGAKNYEELPPEQVWQKIKKGKNSRYVFFLRFHKWRIAAFIALVAMVSSGFYYFKISQKVKISKTEVKKESFIINTPEIVSQNQIDDNNSISSNKYSEEFIDKNVTNSNHTAKENQNNISVNNNSEKNIEENQDKNIVITNEEIFENTNKFNIYEIISKEIKGLKYSTIPIFEKYTPVNKKFHKNWIKNKNEGKDKIVPKGLYSIEIGGGPSYAFRNLSGGNYLLRNESEKAMISFQTNVKVNYHLNPKFSVQTGISVETRNEKLNYNHTELQKKLVETPRVITVFHPVLPPKNITVIDTSYINQTVKYDFENINKYTTFNIPLLFGYNFGNSKLQYRISGGTLINIFSSNNAKIVEKNTTETTLVNYKEAKKINPSIYTAVGLNKVINNHYSIVFEMSYYRNMLNRLGSESNIKQINSGINFSSAIRYNFLK
ncbi:MAG: outer membrane beta-barrel protein [Bacteroidetes bacterium]|nr:outer membrane beta-barrel protein [Bacteroidota bacterium]